MDSMKSLWWSEEVEAIYKSSQKISKAVVLIIIIARTFSLAIWPSYHTLVLWIPTFCTHILIYLFLKSAEYKSAVYKAISILIFAEYWNNISIFIWSPYLQVHSGLAEMFSYISIYHFMIPVVKNQWLWNLFLIKHLYIWHIHKIIIEGEVRLDHVSPFLILVIIIVVCNDRAQFRQSISFERFLYRKELELSRSKLATITQAVENGILIISNEKIEFYNSSILQLLGCEGNNLYSVLQRIEYCLDKKVTKMTNSILLFDDINFALENIINNEICLGITKQGTINLEWRVKKIIWESRPCIFLSIRNANQIIEMESNIANDKMKTILLRSVSHELRTPLTAITHFISEFSEQKKHKLNSEDIEQLAIISTSSKLMLSLINDLLDYSKILAGVFSIRKTYCKFREILKNTCELITIQAKKKKIVFICRVDPTIPEEIYTDSLRLSQVLLNLLSNALKFTMKGRIEISCLIDANGKLKCYVEDTGIGISESMMKKLFIAFSSQNSSSINPNGSGLGLSISNFLVKSLGEHPIKVKSQVGKGSMFWFSIDIFQGKYDQGSYEKINTLEPEELHYFSLSKYERYRSNSWTDVLVVDDDEFNLEVIESILNKYHIKHSKAHSGREAIKSIECRDTKHQFKVILMDCNMPEMDGLETTREIDLLYKEGKIKNMPYIIAHSAYSSDEDRQLCFRSGMSDYLLKPSPPEEIISTINKYL
ncbi:unnamed protein product [Blepharisma stoltei]|uniref:Histidine kinase n=1 Tax=Blepharisma stoltei TaxID=1481888 RepID=A0AAU9JG18_9CILI|nr:unnamed protein product [Blepharisma stoltei]